MNHNESTKSIGKKFFSYTPALNPKEASEYNIEDLVSNLIKELNLVVSKVEQLEQTIQNFALILREKFMVNDCNIPEFLSSDIPESNLLTKVDSINYSSLSIAGIDGGLITSSLVGIDIIGVRSLGVLIDYGHNQINRVTYFPNKKPPIKILPIFHKFSRLDLDQFSSLNRGILELKTACQLIASSSKNVDFLLMDGTFQYKKSPLIRNKRVLSLEERYFKLLKDLYTTAKKNGTEIIWIVKDSRKTLFLEALGYLIPHIISTVPELYSTNYRQIITNSIRDSSFMYHFLPINYRSFLVKRNLLDKSKKEINKEIYSFYLSTVSYDIPLRIDFATQSSLTKSELFAIAQKYASIILPLSQFNSFYSLPAPIIEADARTRIHHQEFNFVLEYIRKHSSNQSMELRPLRRNRNPFRF